MQTMQVGDGWVVDTFKDNVYVGREKGFARVVDAIRYINSEIEKV